MSPLQPELTASNIPADKYIRARILANNIAEKKLLAQLKSRAEQEKIEEKQQIAKWKQEQSQQRKQEIESIRQEKITARKEAEKKQLEAARQRREALREKQQYPAGEKTIARIEKAEQIKERSKKEKEKLAVLQNTKTKDNALIQKTEEKLSQLKERKLILLARVENSRENQQSKINKYLSLGKTNYQHNNYNAAMREWAKVLALDSANTEAREGILKAEKALKNNYTAD